MARAARAFGEHGLSETPGARVEQSRVRARARVDGTVQGVGFRPYVYRLAGELRLGGWVRNDEQGVELEVEGAREAVEAFLERLPAEAPPMAIVERVSAEPRDPHEEHGFVIAPSANAGAPDAMVAPDIATCADCLCGASRPRRPPLPLSLRQLHQLRPAFHDRARRPLRPAADDDGRLSDVRDVPGRVRGSRQPPLPRPAERMPGVRTAGAVARRRRAGDLGGWRGAGA